MAFYPFQENGRVHFHQKRFQRLSDLFRGAGRKDFCSVDVLSEGWAELSVFWDHLGTGGGIRVGVGLVLFRLRIGSRDEIQKDFFMRQLRGDDPS